MIYSESALARRIFAQFLPAYASRGGYFDGVSAEGLFPEGIYPIPVHLAPAASLDGIWVDSDHAPQNSRDLAGLLQTLGSGGVGVLFLSSKHWSRRAIGHFCRGSGMQLLFLSPILAKGRMKVGRSGLPVPRSIVRRLLLRLGTLFFPSLAALFGSELFVIVQKNPARHRETDGVRLSVIIPAVNPHRLKQWEDFIARHRIHEMELVSVEEDVMPAAAEAIHVQHYRQAGWAASVHSGLLHSRGKSVLIDSDQRSAPAFLFDLMQARLQAKQKVDVVVGLNAAERPWWGRRLLNRWLSGYSDPEPLFLLLNDPAIRTLVDLHPEQLRGYAYSVGLLLRSRLHIEEVDLHLDPPLSARPSKGPSVFSYLFYKLRRGTIHLLLPLVVPALMLGLGSVSFVLPSAAGQDSSDGPASAIWASIAARAAHPVDAEARADVGAPVASESVAEPSDPTGGATDVAGQTSGQLSQPEQSGLGGGASELRAKVGAALEQGLVLSAKGALAAREAAHRGELSFWQMVPPATAEEFLHKISFVFLFGQMIHFWNIVVVFQRPAASWLPWMAALSEALSVPFLLEALSGADGQGMVQLLLQQGSAPLLLGQGLGNPLLSQGLGLVLLKDLLPVFGLHLLFWPVYLWLFRLRRS